MIDMADREDIWDAARATRVVRRPNKSLETFGETSVHYYVVSELLDSIDEVRIRSGLISALRPKVVTPHYQFSEALENFGEDARRYAEWILSSAEGRPIVQYHLRFRKEEHGEEVVSGNVNDVADQISNDVEGRADGIFGVVIGMDDLWEISLFEFALAVIAQSAPRNLQDLSERGLLDASSGGVPNAVRIEIESDFRGAERNRDRIDALGRKLRKYGLFSAYEDRFYALLRDV